MNSAAVFITDGKGHSFEVFQETSRKPYELPINPLSDAITFFMDDFCGMLLDMMHAVSKTALGCVDETAANALSQSSSVDEQYIGKLIEKSEKRHQNSGSTKVQSPSKDSKQAKPSQSSPKEKPGIDALLNQFEEEMDMSPADLMEDTALLPKKSHQEKVSLALEVNIMKLQSVQLQSKSQQKQRALSEQMSFDKYMDQKGQIEEVRHIREKFDKQIEQALDPAEKQKLYKQMALEQFKAMMKLDRQNELHPSKRGQKAKEEKSGLKKVSEHTLEENDGKELKKEGVKPEVEVAENTTNQSKGISLDEQKQDIDSAYILCQSKEANYHTTQIAGTQLKLAGNHKESTSSIKANSIVQKNSNLSSRARLAKSRDKSRPNATAQLQQIKAIYQPGAAPIRSPKLRKTKPAEFRISSPQKPNPGTYYTRLMSTQILNDTRNLNKRKGSFEMDQMSQPMQSNTPAVIYQTRKNAKFVNVVKPQNKSVDHFTSKKSALSKTRQVKEQKEEGKTEQVIRQTLISAHSPYMSKHNVSKIETIQQSYRNNFPRSLKPILQKTRLGQNQQ